MNRREHAVLSLFYDEGHHELTPSFLAYRMRLRASDATTLLDDLVRQGILDLHLGDDGHISYRLPPGERRWIDQSPRSAATQTYGTSAAGSFHDHNHSPGDTDASLGYGTATNSSLIGQLRSNDDGTDGSVGPSRSFRRGWSATGPADLTAETPPQGRPAQRSSPSTPAQASLVPYQGTHQPLAPRRGSSKRVPVVAAALSLLFPGLGQFYNGEFGKGLLLIFSTAFLAFFLLFWIVWIWSAIDAYMVAQYHNQLRLQHESSPGGLLPGGRNSNTNSPAA